MQRFEKLPFTTRDVSVCSVWVSADNSVLLYENVVLRRGARCSWPERHSNARAREEAHVHQCCAYGDAATVPVDSKLEPGGSTRYRRRKALMKAHHNASIGREKFLFGDDENTLSLDL